ncbi:DUF6228 family protein [Amycolatopsis sp. BJA-103]|uniref:DUF6228 family protein n=1 Tax=Amycolatopsis sp. BJA-103 TaxID=1911175 RepID=UPI000C78E080|nr:DUF6228 family protein [Amycolatopsis sp. BJA-103]
MKQVVIGLDGHALVLSDVVRGAGGEIWSVGVEVVDTGLRAEKTVASHYAVGFDDLVEFFAGMAENWHGWAGDRVYESLEHDLRIVGRHLGSRVCLVVELAEASDPDGWRAEATFTVDAGEQLSAVADDLAALLGVE